MTARDFPENPRNVEEAAGLAGQRAAAAQRSATAGPGTAGELDALAQRHLTSGVDAGGPLDAHLQAARPGRPARSSCSGDNPFGMEGTQALADIARKLERLADGCRKSIGRQHERSLPGHAAPISSATRPPSTPGRWLNWNARVSGLPGPRFPCGQWRLLAERPHASAKRRYAMAQQPEARRRA